MVFICVATPRGHCKMEEPSFVGCFCFFVSGHHFVQFQTMHWKSSFFSSQQYLCHSLYKFDDCYKHSNGRNITVNCSFLEHPNHSQMFCHAKYGEPLLKEVTLKSGGTKLYSFKVYCYNSVIDNLCYFIRRPGFFMKCKMWRNRKVPDGFLVDIFDERV